MEISTKIDIGSHGLGVVGWGAGRRKCGRLHTPPASMTHSLLFIEGDIVLASPTGAVDVHD